MDPVKASLFQKFENQLIHELDHKQTEQDQNVFFQNLVDTLLNKDGNVVEFINSHSDSGLKDSITKLKELGISESEIHTFCIKTLGIETQETQSAPHFPKYSTHEVQFEFLFDIDARDNNGITLFHFEQTLVAQNPIIMTRRAFLGAFLDNDKHWLLEKHYQNITRAFGLYDIYIKGAFLVFVPKHLANEDEKRLEMLDINDKEVHKLTLEEVWQHKDDKIKFSDMQKIFSETPTHNKYFHLLGHGNDKYVGALSKKNYQNFLKFSKQQHCKGLLISSCGSGGSSSLYNLSDYDSKGKFQEAVNFPVLVRSIGSFSTRSGQEAEENVKSLLTKLAEVFKSRGQTTKILKNAILEKEEGKKVKWFTNLLQVFLPHSKDSPGGFRPVGEGEERYSLTFTNYRKAQLVNYGKDEKVEEVVDVGMTEYLELFPIQVDIPIRFSGENSILLSMIPGKAAHLLSKVEVNWQTLDGFIKSNLTFNEKYKLLENKTFLIKDLKASDKSYSQFFINMKTKTYGYKEGSDYYLFKGKDINKKPEKVTPFQFFLAVNQELSSSIPLNEAVRAATGGQQDFNLLLSSWRQQGFFKEGEIFHTYLEFLKFSNIKVMDRGKLDEVIEKCMLSDDDTVDLLKLILPLNEQLACDLFDNRNLDANSKDREGKSLAYYAAQYDSVKLMKLLISKGADINATNPVNSHTCISFAIGRNNTAMLDLLLEQESLNFDHTHPDFIYALGNPSVLPKLLERKNQPIDLNAPIKFSKTKSSPLSTVVEANQKKAVKFLLEKNANPNGASEGNSPLMAAILSGNYKYISKLIEKGANPYIPDANNHIPIIEALKKSPKEIVIELLKFPRPETLEMNRLMSQMYLTALESRDSAKIDAILDKYPSLPGLTDESMLRQIYQSIKNLIDFDNPVLLQNILINSHPYKDLMYYMVADICLKAGKQDLLNSIMKDLNPPPSLTLINDSNLDIETKQSIIFALYLIQHFIALIWSFVNLNKQTTN